MIKLIFWTKIDLPFQLLLQIPYTEIHPFQTSLTQEGDNFQNGQKKLLFTSVAFMDYSMDQYMHTVVCYTAW